MSETDREFGVFVPRQMFAPAPGQGGALADPPQGEVLSEATILQLQEEFQQAELKVRREVAFDSLDAKTVTDRLALPYPPQCHQLVGIEVPSVGTSLPSTKPTNPKDLIGTNKVPLSLVPETATAYASLGLLEGMLKYGATNWRHTGVRASIYVDALYRHIGKWRNGEECDPVTKVPHLANAIACLCILIDAKECGKLTDDRPLGAPVAETIDRLAATVAHLRDLFKDCHPTHYTAVGPITEAR